MLRKMQREKLPIRFKIHDSNWNRGIVIGNTVIFNNKKYRMETKQIKTIYQYDNHTHGFYVEYKKDPVLQIIYLRD